MLAMLHPGAMGSAVAACLTSVGHEVGWLRAGRSHATARRATASGLIAFDRMDDLLEASDVVFSICPPHGAVDVARQVAGFGGTVVDANAVSPQTSELIGHDLTTGGAHYVDGGIIGPPPAASGSTRLYLAGDDGGVADLFVGSALTVIDMAAPPPAASALKMAYAAWTKTTAALLVSIERAAVRYGVDDHLAAEWAISQPDLAAALAVAHQQTAEKGWRWAYELAEVGRTFAAVGEPEGFGRAASEVFEAGGERSGS